MLLVAVMWEESAIESLFPLGPATLTTHNCEASATSSVLPRSTPAEPVESGRNEALHVVVVRLVLV